MTRRHYLAVAVAAVVGLGFFLMPHKPPQAAPVPATPHAAMTVTTAMPLQQSWPQSIQANGSLLAWQEAIIGAETGSLRITDLYVDVGAHVKKGQELAQLSQDNLKAQVQKQEATVAEAQATLNQAAANAERARSIKDSGALSAEKFNDYQITEATARASLDAAKADLAATRLQLSQTRIVAVDDGIISSRSAVLGNVVSTGAELFRLLRQGRIEWQAELDGVQLGQVRAGQAARVTLPDGSTVVGKVRLVAPTLSSSTGRGIVYVSLPESSARTGMYASGEIDLDSTAALTVPASAIVLRDGRSYVYTVDGQQQARRQSVTTGRRNADAVEIVSGLTAGTAVVNSGGAFLSDGMKVAIEKAGG